MFGLLPPSMLLNMTVVIADQLWLLLHGMLEKDMISRNCTAASLLSYRWQPKPLHAACSSLRCRC
jgi:hypothetical protein